MHVNIDGDTGHVPAIDSMAVATRTNNDACWVERMQVNNESLNYDFSNVDDVEGDGEEAQMEVPLDDDLCTAQMMA